MFCRHTQNPDLCFHAWIWIFKDKAHGQGACHHPLPIGSPAASPRRPHDQDALQQLLHAEFEEIGRSGQLHSRDAILAALRHEALPHEIAADAYVATEIQPGVALLTYRSAYRQQDGTLTGHTLRASLWVRCAERWQLRYHQGTPTSDIW
ncbi:MAG: nuclear transport factor 2 family protein [Acidovorax sp.]|nr:nuclear transport factor 2 family protein [Acidovorax sp.]